MQKLPIFALNFRAFMFYRSILVFPAVLFIAFCLSNCTSKKKVLYFQEQQTAADESTFHSPVFAPDDILSITVMGREPAAALPFNIPVQNFNNNQGGYTTGTPSPPGYLVDSEGNIEFPVLGKLKVAGLSRTQLVTMLTEKLNTYLNNPTIIVRLLNFRVTVLGEVRNPGTFTIPNEKVSLLEVLGIAGDLSIYGRRKNIFVVRTTNGKRTEARIDLTSKELFKSPFYYMQQNDVVYVEPNRARINSAAVNPANIGLIVSVVSLLITVSVLLTQ